MQSSVPCRAARPAAPRRRSSALGTRPTRAARPVSGTRPGPAPCHAARVLRRRGRRGRGARRLDQIWPLELGPTSWRSASGTSRRTAVPAVRAPGRGARGPYAGTSPRSSWARPAARLGPGGLPTVRGGAPGRARAGPAEVVRVVPTENLAPGGLGGRSSRTGSGAGRGRAGGGEPGGGGSPAPSPGRYPPKASALNSTAESIAGRPPAPARPPRGGARGHRQASANGRPPPPRRPPAGAPRLSRPPRPDRLGRGSRPLPATPPRGGPRGPSPSRPPAPFPEPFPPLPGTPRRPRGPRGAGAGGWLASRRLGAPGRPPPWGLPAGAGRRRGPGGYRMAMRPADMQAVPLAGLPDRRLGRRGLRRTRTPRRRGGDGARYGMTEGAAGGFGTGTTSAGGQPAARATANKS